ncbi:hypothetical protein GCM10010873_36840 [Cypionkella aquatica]|uniref:Uncharacterized protein n=1 Tax=Cypionkella aquatica TaxID=1756042 RepID=A0AA37U0F7_9RHOB|nr:hypothetical protein GCM10010873_36840 [Cypionkella aquatica]
MLFGLLQVSIWKRAMQRSHPGPMAQVQSLGSYAAGRGDLLFAVIGTPPCTADLLLRNEVNTLLTGFALLKILKFKPVLHAHRWQIIPEGGQLVLGFTCS